MMRKSKPFSLVLSLLTALAVLSGAVAVPLLCRPFYYAHIQALDLPGRTGLTAEQIRQAFDQVMDFCLGLRPDFAAGVLWFSESGASHFADVRRLFLLDLWVLGLSLAGLAAAFVYSRVRKTSPWCFKGRGPGFWGACGLGVFFLVVGALAAVDFDRAFVVFHALFFPGKTNWVFDWQEDPIILLLPQEFFQNCALLIFFLLLAWCATLILADLWAGKRRKKALDACPPCLRAQQSGR